MPEYTLGEIAKALGAELVGDPASPVRGLNTLQKAGAGEVAFLANAIYRRYLATTRATAVILSPEYRNECPVNALVTGNPYAAFARLTSWFSRVPHPASGIHSSALVAETAQVAASASIGPFCVISEGAVIGERSVLHSGVVIGEGSRVGDDCCLHSHVTLYHGVTLGNAVMVHSSAVIGADGFGFAPSAAGWIKIAQNGGVRIGNRVEIGAGTTIDRGAIEDTVIEDGVIIDNQVQIAHNVHIGRNTAIAGCTAVAGSTRIGANCTIAGAVGITGHLEITDGVHVTAMSLISKSIDRPGTYSSGTAMSATRDWRKNAVRFLQLDGLFRRVSDLEKKAGVDTKD